MQIIKLITVQTRQEMGTKEASDTANPRKQYPKRDPTQSKSFKQPVRIKKNGWGDFDGGTTT